MSDAPTQTSLELNEPAALRRARLVVAYDGSGFHGFAAAEGVQTVMGTLLEAVSRVARLSETELGAVGAGRTDAGVHAWGQVVSMDLPVGLALDGLVNRLNKLLGPSISVRSAVWASSPSFNARFDAQWRHYRYDVWNSPAAVPVYAGTTWHIRQPLQLWAMQLACDPLIGEHDFSTFCRKPKVFPDAAVPSMRRRVVSAGWHVVHDDHHVGEELDGASIAPVSAPSDSDDLAGIGLGLMRFEIRANAFCHQMVRSIVGLLVDVGLGRRSAGEMRTVLAAADRAEGGQVAPPHGLTLWLSLIHI